VVAERPILRHPIISELRECVYLYVIWGKWLSTGKKYARLLTFDVSTLSQSFVHHCIFN
jgi:hypothetical protein